MEQQFLRPNEERRLNVKPLSDIDNVVPRAREALATSPRGLLNYQTYNFSAQMRAYADNRPRPMDRRAI